MLQYCTFGTNDLEKSVAFFDAVLAPLGYKKFYDEGMAGYAPEGDPSKSGSVWVGQPYNGKEAVKSNGAMIGFAAPSRAAVRAFHEAALANGGCSEGEPGIREAYGPNIYMAYVRDPVGNKMSAMSVTDSE